MTPGIKTIAFCPHCSHRAPIELVYAQHYAEDLVADDGETTEAVPGVYFVGICDVCSQVILYHGFGDRSDHQFTLADIVWPKDGTLHDSVPPRIRDIYHEAHAIRNAAPNAFAVQIRRALEALCDDRGAPGRVLAARLQELVKRGELPPVLAEMTQVLRLLGNIGAHATESNVHAGQVYPIDEFFRAVIEYVYIGPAKIRRFKEGLSGLGSDSNDA